MTDNTDTTTNEEAWEMYILQCFDDLPEFRYAIVNLFNKV